MTRATAIDGQRLVDVAQTSEPQDAIKNHGLYLLSSDEGLFVHAVQRISRPVGSWPLKLACLRCQSAFSCAMYAMLQESPDVYC